MSEVYCFDNIIGLTRADCDCEYPHDIDPIASVSGIYITDHIPLSRVRGITNCETSDVFTHLDRIREQATNAFVSDVNAMMLREYKPRRTPYKGGIGRAKYKSAMTLANGRYYGIRLYCANVRGGKMTIRNVGTIFSSTGTVEVSLYNNKNEELETATINTTENRHVQTQVNWEVDLHDYYVDNVEYFIVYRYLDGLPRPYDNDVKCNCGLFKPYYNINHPIWGARAEEIYGWNKYLMVGGYAGSADFMRAPSVAPNKLYGLTLEVDIKCNTSEVICKDTLDFDSNPLANAMAYAILYKAIELLLLASMHTDEINRSSMINNEQDVLELKQYQRKYESLMQYIVNHIDISVNDCFDCRSFIDIKKSGIKA